jgi:hypothetical protein
LKALSDQQIADLRAGRGMGLALPAELNGYPGPLHTLESAEALMLSPAQRMRTEALFQAMKDEVVPLGERLIEQETELDRLFATRAVASRELGSNHPRDRRNARGAQDRAPPVSPAMVEVLTPWQIQKYAEVRGYTAASAPGEAGTALTRTDPRGRQTGEKLPGQVLRSFFRFTWRRSPARCDQNRSGSVEHFCPVSVRIDAQGSF